MNYKHRLHKKILYLSQDILCKKIDVIEGFRQLEDLYCNLVKNISNYDKYYNFICGFCDETEEFPRGATRKLCAVDYLKKLDEKETECLEASQQEVHNFLIQLIKYLENNGDLTEKVWT